MPRTAWDGTRRGLWAPLARAPAMPVCFRVLMRCTCSRVFSTSKGHTKVAVRAPVRAWVRGTRLSGHGMRGRRTHTCPYYPRGAACLPASAPDTALIISASPIALFCGWQAGRQAGTAHDVAMASRRTCARGGRAACCAAPSSPRCAPPWLGWPFSGPPPGPLLPLLRARRAGGAPGACHRPAPPLNYPASSWAMAWARRWAWGGSACDCGFAQTHPLTLGAGFLPASKANPADDEAPAGACRAWRCAAMRARGAGPREPASGRDVPLPAQRGHAGRARGVHAGAVQHDAGCGGAGGALAEA